MELDQEIIKNNPYFKSLDETNYSNLLNHATIITLKKNDVLFHEGDFADAFYIVKKGSIKITTIDAHGQTIVLAKITDSEFFGEQAFSPSSSPRRQATASAKSDTVLYKFPRESLLDLSAIKSLNTLLRKKNLAYLKEKLSKLSSNIQQSSYDIKKLISNKSFYPRRSIIFYQGDMAKNTFILVSGEIELRSYDKEKQIKQIVRINPGHIFGTEGLTNEKALYNFTAVAKQKSRVIIIDISEYNEIAKQYPYLNQLCANFNRQFAFKTKGNILQFRSEYLDMPATTSVISLNDGKEIVCQQVIGEDIFLVNFTNCTPTNKLQYVQDKYHTRVLNFVNDKIVGLIDYGLWDDSYLILDLIADETSLSQEQIVEFSKTGHFTLKKKSDQDDHLVCKCMRVSFKTINKLIAEQNANINDISQKTGAGTICGGCKPIIMEMLGMNAWVPCLVTKVIDHTSEIKSFQLKPTNESIHPNKPGQYLLVKAQINNAWIQRTYTLTSVPDDPFYEITVKKESKGIFSPWLFEQIENKSLIYVLGPYGKFTLEEPIKPSIVCFMGGIGITPAVAYLRYFAKFKKDQNIYVDYSAFHANQFILNDEFDYITSKNKNILINHRITSIHGLLTEEEISNIIASFNNCHVYVCGPNGMIQFVMEALKKTQIPSDRIHVEEFIHAGAPDNLPQTIEFD